LADAPRRAGYDWVFGVAEAAQYPIAQVSCAGKSVSMPTPAAESNGPPQVGAKAPVFDLPAFPEADIAVKGKVKLSQFKGKQNVVLYFYPRDNTPGCTTEACEFRDHLPTFAAADTVVLGVSDDPLESHQKFAEKFSLPFPLLADVDHVVAEKYGVWVEKNMYGKKSMGMQRATFLIDKSGKIAAAWPKVKVDGHVAAVADALAKLE
jgi:thioredoxin-dependent peroxiredoxin